MAPFWMFTTDLWCTKNNDFVMKFAKNFVCPEMSQLPAGTPDLLLLLLLSLLLFTGEGDGRWY